jgi:hypothetical protein
MMRLGLAPVTFLTLLVTCTWLSYAGWLTSGGSAASPRKAEARVLARDPWNTEAAWRHRRVQPRHWSALVLHR